MLILRHDIKKMTAWFNKSCCVFVYMHVTLLGGSGFRSDRGGVVHDETVSGVGDDRVSHSAEKQKILLDVHQTTATALLHRWSEPVLNSLYLLTVYVGESCNKVLDSSASYR